MKRGKCTENLRNLYDDRTNDHEIVSDLPSHHIGHKKTKLDSEQQKQQQPLPPEKNCGLLSLLSRDEIGIVLEFLFPGQILMISLCSKWWYSWICSVVKEKFSKYAIQGPTMEMNSIEDDSDSGESSSSSSSSSSSMNDEDEDDQISGWALTRAVRGAKRLFITLENINLVRQVVNEIAERDGSLCELSKRFEFGSICNSTKIYEILNIRKACHENSKMVVKTVVWKMSNDLEKNSSDHDTSFKEIETKSVPIGFGLKELSFQNVELRREHLFRILTKCCEIEKLDLCISEPQSRRGKPPRIEEEEDEFFNKQEGHIFIPVFETLKSLTLNAPYYYDEAEKFMFDILTICPRLEELYYTFNSDIYNSFIIQLAKLCPNLKKIQILCNDDCSSELQVTDEGLYEFLKLLPQLEYVSFHPCSNIRGEIFKKIGEFSQLKYFNITRGSYDQPVPLEKDIHFGGGTLSKLECIDFGSKEYSFSTSEEFDKFVTTLRSVAPHLKYLGDLLDIDVSMDDKKKGVQLFSDTLTDLDVGFTVNHLAPILPKKLTSLRMKINDEFVSQNVLNQLQPNHSLKKLSITVGRQISPEIIVAIIEKLAVDIYPCVTHLEFYSTTKQKKVSTNPHGEILDTVLSNIKIWPNLCFLDGEVLSMNRILAVRPRLRFYSMWDNDLNFDDNVSLFYYQWLVLDQPFEEW